MDCNNFFASCERLFRPDLIGKPVVVLSSNDGCVVARSKEAKQLGIPMGVPQFKIKKELQNVAVFSSNFTLYRDISARVMRVLKEEVSDATPYSIDEAFFTLTAASIEDVEARISHIKRMVEAKVGVPVTVGAALTKTIAKCATELGKKEKGLNVLTGPSWYAAAEAFPLSDVWGIGGKTAEKMREENLHTVSDLLRADPALIRNKFGIHGARIQTELREVRAESGRHDDLQKSIMHTRSFKTTTTERSVLEDAVAYHLAHAAEELRELGAVAKEVRVLIRTSRHGDWFLRGGSDVRVLPVPTDDTRVLLKEALALVRALYEPNVPYKKAGVILSRIEYRDAVPLSLFPLANDRSLLATIDAINHKFGAHLVTIGRTGDGAKWQASKLHVSPHYTTKWRDIPTVVA
jgi:DNA polymerase V